MRQANNIILRPIEENVDETEIEHKGKKFIIDEIIRQQIEASKQ